MYGGNMSRQSTKHKAQSTKHKAQSTNKILTALTLSATLTLPLPSLAASITNGDFASGDFTGWSLDTDGFTGTAPDFQIETSGGNSYARIEADYWSTPGDTLSDAQDWVWFANTLFQDLDLSANATDLLQLTFDWTFDGESTQNLDEYFLVGLGDGSGSYYGADGSLGFLMEQMTYGSGNASFLLDSSFINSTGWTLEFQLAAGFDGYGSFLNIDNVALAAIPQEEESNNVPAPPALWLLVTGGLAFMVGRRQSSPI
jgi:hypothetical protein